MGITPVPVALPARPLRDRGHQAVHRAPNTGLGSEEANATVLLDALGRQLRRRRRGVPAAYLVDFYWLSSSI